MFCCVMFMSIYKEKFKVSTKAYVQNNIQHEYLRHK